MPNGKTNIGTCLSQSRQPDLLPSVLLGSPCEEADTDVHWGNRNRQHVVEGAQKKDARLPEGQNRLLGLVERGPRVSALVDVDAAARLAGELLLVREPAEQGVLRREADGLQVGEVSADDGDAVEQLLDA